MNLYDKDNIRINAHSSIRIEAGAVMYFDPYLGPAETHDADIIFITHSHHDHLSPEDIGLVAKPGTVFVAPESIKKEMSKAGYDPDSVVFVNPGDEKEVCGVNVKAVPAYNILKPFHPKHNKWVGYVVTAQGVSYYVCGDTDATKEAKAVKCDVLLVPVGGTYTTNAKEAAELTKAIAPKLAIPTHYGSAVGKPGDGDEYYSYIK